MLIETFIYRYIFYLSIQLIYKVTLIYFKRYYLSYKLCTLWFCQYHLTHFIRTRIMQRERYDHSRAFFVLPEAAHRWRCRFFCWSSNSYNISRSQSSTLSQCSSPTCPHGCRIALLSFLPTYFHSVHYHDIFRRHCSCFE